MASRSDNEQRTEADATLSAFLFVPGTDDVVVDFDDERAERLEDPKISHVAE